MVGVSDIALGLRGDIWARVLFENISVSRKTVICMLVCMFLLLVAIGKHFGLNLILKYKSNAY